MTKPAGINIKLTKSFELGNNRLITNGVAAIPKTIGSSSQHNKDIEESTMLIRGTTK